MKVLTGFKVTGIENVTRIRGKKIFAVNHISQLDPLCVRGALPWFWRGGPMYYMARPREFYPKEQFGWKHYLYGGIFFALWGAYPVYKGLKDYEKALVLHTKILTQGKALCVFPEGKIREDADKRPHGGVAFLAHATHSPVIPVHITGLEHLSFKELFSRKRKVEIHFGKPISYKEMFGNMSITVSDFAKKAAYIMSK